MKNFDNNLKQYRLKAKMTRDELVTATGISSTMLYYLEKGNRGVSYFLADRIAFVLNVPLEEVFPEFKKRKSPILTAK
jgi:transcriptional regulator with XRE-family HTH domain